MTWNEYLPLAEKTLSLQFNCEEDFYQKILHAIIGCLTEVEEILNNYDEDKLVGSVDKQSGLGEEAADIYWYLSILFRELKIGNHNYSLSNEFNLKTPFNTLLTFTKLSLQFLDLLKKKIYYNKPINNDIMVDLAIKMQSILNYYCYQYNIDVDAILDKNIDKLRARYSDKFSSERAINRDLETERTILEGK